MCHGEENTASDQQAAATVLPSELCTGGKQRRKRGVPGVPEPALPSRGRRASKAEGEGVLGTVTLSQAVTSILITLQTPQITEYRSSARNNLSSELRLKTYSLLNTQIADNTCTHLLKVTGN